MNRSAVITVVIAAGFVACGATWVSLPVLQDRQQSASSEVSTQLERARRLLYKHDFGLARKSLLLDRIFKTGVDVDVEDPAELAEAMADEYQAVHERLWDSFQPVDLRDGEARDARASYGNLARQIREGINARKALLNENDRWLEEAVATVDEAFATIDREVPASTYAEAFRLKGVILYHMGISEWLSALARHREAEPFRARLVTLAAEVADRKSGTTALAVSDITQRIEKLKERKRQTEAALREDRKKLQELEAVISQLETRLAGAQSRRDAAREAMQAMIDRGIEWTDPNGAEAFKTGLLKKNRLFREAEREVAVLTSGTYQAAKLDRPEDYLGGTYVSHDAQGPLTVEHGLRHYRDRRAVLSARIQIQTDALETLRTDDLERLNQLKASFQEEQDRATDLMAKGVSKARATYDELNRIESEAFSFEEAAMGHFRDASAACARAATAARDWTQGARNRMNGISPAAKSRSAFTDRQDDEWMTGHIKAQEADAHLALAWVQYDRYAASKQTADALASVTETIDLREVDLDDNRAKVSAARDAGVEEVSKTLSILEKAHRSAERHWTITAQAAGAQYLLVLFGYPSALNDAVEAYRSAVKGREDKDFAEIIVQRLATLENR